MFEIYITILIIHFSGLILPGPDFFIVSRYSAINGLKSGMACVLGIVSGIIINLLITYFIGSFLYTKNKFLYIIFILFGVLFLYKLSIKLISNFYFKRNKNYEQNLDDHEQNIGSAYKNGLLTNISNIKVIIFFSSFLPFLNKLNNFYIVLTFLSITLSTFLWFALVTLIFNHKFIKNIINKKIHIFEFFVGIIIFIFASVIFYEYIWKYCLSLFYN